MSLQSKQVPLPLNEQQRLQALRGYAIMDSAPEVDFDALTRLAAYALEVPAAVVGLMEADRLWFKSRFGLDLPQMDRQIAFCAYTVMQPDELLVVEDLTQDERFRDNPLVLNAPHLRFYAGAPLTDKQGNVLGTIAVVDVQPRTLSEVQRRVLADFATLVMMALESHRRSVQLARLARTDHLTGLSNRADFEAALAAQMAHTGRSGEPFALLYMDLDGFKLANDEFGHATGDEVLYQVARRLEQQVRQEDVLARLGGDEFGVVIRGGTQESAMRLAQRIEEALVPPVLMENGAQVCIGISIGIAIYSDASEQRAALLARADEQLYRLKRDRR